MSNKCHDATCNAGPALNAIKEQISNAIEQGKRILEGGLDWNTFTRHCNELRATMVEFFSLSPSPTQQLLQLREETKNVVEIAKKMEGKLNLSSSVEDFIKKCEDINTHIGQLPTDGQKNSLDHRLKNLNEHINDIGKIIESFKTQGVFSIETSKFLQSCKNIQRKLESHARKMQNDGEIKVNLYTDQQRLTEFIKNKLPSVEVMTQDIIKEGVASSILQTFLNACRDFRSKLEENSIVETFSDTKGEELANGFINSINSMLDIINEMKLKGQSSDSLEEFVRTCTQIKKVFAIEKYVNKPVLDIDKYMINATCHKSCQCDTIRDSRKCVPKILSPSKAIEVPECDDACDSLGFHETRVKKIITLKRYRDETGVMKEQTDTIVLKESSYDPTVNLMPEDVDDDDLTVKSIEVETYKNLPYTYCSDTGGSSTEDKRHNKNKTVGYIVSVPSNQFKEVKKAKSLLVFRTTFSTELVKKRSMSFSSMSKGENVDDKNANLNKPWCNALLSSEMLQSSMELIQN